MKQRIAYLKPETFFGSADMAYDLAKFGLVRSCV